MQFINFIVHGLNLNGGSPTFRDDVLILNGPSGTDVKNFFEQHITNSRRASATKQARFENVGFNDALEKIKRMFRIDAENNFTVNTDEFINSSKWLTNKIRESITRTSSKSDGSIFFIIYQQDENYYLAIIKMDPDIGVQINDDLTVQLQENMLPSLKEKLHKIAIVKLLPEYEENELHMFVLDRQIGKDQESKFFMKEFLSASQMATNKTLTSYFQNNLFTIAEDLVDNQHIPELKSLISNRLHSGQEFNLDTDFFPLVQDKIRNDVEDPGASIDANIDDFKIKVLDKYPDAVFDFTPEQQEVRDSKYRTDDKGIELKISSNYVYNEDYTVNVGRNETTIILRNGIANTFKER